MKHHYMQPLRVNKIGSAFGSDALCVITMNTACEFFSCEFIWHSHERPKCPIRVGNFLNCVCLIQSHHDSHAETMNSNILIIFDHGDHCTCLMLEFFSNFTNLQIMSLIHANQKIDKFSQTCGIMVLINFILILILMLKAQAESIDHSSHVLTENYTVF